MNINGIPLLQEDHNGECLTLRFAKEPTEELVAPFLIETDDGEEVFPADELSAYTELKSKIVDYNKGGECVIVFGKPSAELQRIAELEEQLKQKQDELEAEKAFTALLTDADAPDVPVDPEPIEPDDDTPAESEAADNGTEKADETSATE